MLCHGVLCIFLTTSLSYAAVAFYFGQYEKLLRYRKLATSYMVKGIDEQDIFYRVSLILAAITLPGRRACMDAGWPFCVGSALQLPQRRTASTPYLDHLGPRGHGPHRSRSVAPLSSRLHHCTGATLGAGPLPTKVCLIVSRCPGIQRMEGGAGVIVRQNMLMRIPSCRHKGCTDLAQPNTVAPPSTDEREVLRHTRMMWLGLHDEGGTI